jgi:hypothetical protein
MLRNLTVVVGTLVRVVEAALVVDVVDPHLLPLEIALPVNCATNMVILFSNAGTGLMRTLFQTLLLQRLIPKALMNLQIPLLRLALQILLLQLKIWLFLHPGSLILALRTTLLLMLLMLL